MLDSCCSDDIVLSIASYLRPIDHLSLALTCRRYGLGTNEIMSLEDMTRKIQQQQMKYLLHMTDESAISISFYIPDKSINDNLSYWPECIEMIKTRKKAEKLNTSFGVRSWSLMEEAALRRTLMFLSRDKGILVWKGESWMGIYDDFRAELTTLWSEDARLVQEYAEIFKVYEEPAKALVDLEIIVSIVLFLLLSVCKSI